MRGTRVPGAPVSGGKTWFCGISLQQVVVRVSGVNITTVVLIPRLEVTATVRMLCSKVGHGVSTFLDFPEGMKTNHQLLMHKLWPFRFLLCVIITVTLKSSDFRAFSFQ